MDPFLAEKLSKEILEHEQAAYWLGVYVYDLRDKVERELQHANMLGMEEAARAHDLRVIFDYESGKP